MVELGALTGGGLCDCSVGGACGWCDAGARRCDECTVVAVVVLLTHTQNCTSG